MSISVTTRRMSAPVLTNRRNIQGACLLLLVCTFACLLIGCSGSGDRMRQQLQQLQARNQSDSLMTDDSLATALCTWFDRHGTPNERMLAHYLLGRTWADKGEAPQALEEYHTAAECADTTAADCDYYILCRLYAQMSSVFYQQNLMDSYLQCLDISIACAEKANDTLMSINEYAYKMIAYSRLNMHDSVLSVYENISKRCHSLGMQRRAAQYAGMAIGSCLQKHLFDKARQYMDIYETESGFFDGNHEMAKGHEVYYYQKGTYFLLTQQYDSAEHYFRKELNEAHDYNNQNAGSRGLSLLYKQTGMSDSAVKYALYSYEMNDSLYAQMATREIEQAKKMYDYTRHQNLARQAEKQAEHERNRFRMFLLFIIGIGGVIAFLFSKWYKRRKAERILFQQQLDYLEKTQTELLRLRSHEEQLEALIDEKEKEVERLRSDIMRSHRFANQNQEKAERQLRESAIYTTLSKKSNIGSTLTEEEWHELNCLVMEVLPNFYQFISNRQYALNVNEYRACILFRLHIKSGSVSHLLEVVPSYVTKMSKQLLIKLFKSEGTSKDLGEKLSEIC